jgi:hypothetical protein
MKMTPLRAMLVLLGVSLAGCGAANSESPRGETAAASSECIDVARRAEENEKQVITTMNEQLASAKDLARRERAARVEAEVKAAVEEHEAAVNLANAAMLKVMLDISKGTNRDADVAEVNAADAHLETFGKGCDPKEPVNACVARKARAVAEAQ